MYVDKNIKKVLIIKPSGIGDIVHSFPVAIGLKRYLGDIKTAWVVFTRFKDIFKNFSYVDDLILWDREGGIKEFLRVIKEIRSREYDLVIDLQGLTRTAVLSFFSGGESRLAVSFLREAAFLFEKPIEKFNPREHAVDRNYKVVKFLCKGDCAEPLDFLPWIKVSNEEERKYEAYFSDKKKKYVLFNTTSRGKHKIWNKDYFVELINLLSREYNIVAIFVGTESEKGIVDYITNRITCDFISFAGKTTLSEVCAVVNKCDFVVGNDSGILHIAAALDKPVLGIFGPTNPDWFYPYNRNSSYIYKKFKCSPCGVKTICRNYRCLDAIKPHEVFEYIKNNFSRLLF